MRRELHSKPELMYEEVETSKIIQRELKKLDIPFTSGIGKTGVIGVIGTGEEPVIALRADIDALPLEEESGVPFRSQHPGRMHACGHDIHTTMLLGAGRLLKKLESSGELGKGTIKLAFQPAEEGGAGALHIREHLKDIKAIYGFHIWPGVPTGTVASRSGTIMASAAFFKCFFKGKGTHGAMPHLGRDPVVAASAAIQALQTLVSRRTSPLDSSVVSVTQFKAGEAYNVIPDEVMIGGTMRALTEDAMELLVEGARGMVESIGAGYGMTTTCDFMEDVHPITPPVVNSKEAFHFATEVGRMMLGEEKVIETEPTMGAEDFSYYTQKVFYCRLTSSLFVPSRLFLFTNSLHFHFCRRMELSYSLEEEGSTHCIIRSFMLMKRCFPLVRHTTRRWQSVQWSRKVRTSCNLMKDVLQYCSLHLFSYSKIAEHKPCRALISFSVTPDLDKIDRRCPKIFLLFL